MKNKLSKSMNKEILVNSNIDKAAQILLDGGVIAYPTETYYGLGCSAFNEKALRRIYEIKERSLTQPLPLIVRDFKQVLEIADIPTSIFTSIEEITQHFWAGSLSLLLKSKEHISPIITANTSTIVVRQSPHKAVIELMKKVDAPIISTSANKSGEKPAQFSYEVDNNLDIDFILEHDEKPQGGLPSTIIKVKEEKKIHLIRKGAFDIHLLENLNYTIQK